jgi:two-component system, OmpR family, heavy metal sensor histidine kinase CusS
MSSKSADTPSQEGRSRWSIAATLTAYFSFSVFTLLAVASLVLYWGLERSLRQDSRDQLLHKVQVLTQLLQKQPVDREGIEQEVSEEAQISTESQSPFFLRILDEQDHLLTETPGMALALPAAAFPKADSSVMQEHRWNPPGGDSHYVLAASLIPAIASISQGWQIQAATETTAVEQLLAGYRRDIALVLLGGLLTAAPIGAWVARRGLKPIAEIARATECIDAQQLQQRVNARSWPKELVVMANSFDRMLARLQESFQRLSQFSADLAHELRTPINNLMGEAQVLLSRQRAEDEYVKVLQSGLEEHERLARMIDSMLFLAQADQARSALSPVPLDLRAELEAVADFYHALAEEEGVQLRCEGYGEVNADPQLLRRAISNLLANALKHSQRGASIILRVSKAAREVRLSIVDTGPGIATEHLAKLGDRFYRVDPARSGNTASAGLGLAIVKSIMSLHGGQLRIDSTVGSGTEASLVFSIAN